MDFLVGNKKITYGEKCDISIFKKNGKIIMPIINFDKNPNKLYTIMMIDPDAPSMKNNKYKYWLHLLIINNNDVIVPYHPPDPPIGSGKHRYYVLIFEQNEKISSLPVINKREKFNVNDFIKKYNILLIHKMKFTTKQD